MGGRRVRRVGGAGRGTREMGRRRRCTCLSTAVIPPIWIIKSKSVFLIHQRPHCSQIAPRCAADVAACWEPIAAAAAAAAAAALTYGCNQSVGNIRNPESVPTMKNKSELLRGWWDPLPQSRFIFRQSCEIAHFFFSQAHKVFHLTVR